MAPKWAADMRPVWFLQMGSMLVPYGQPMSLRYGLYLGPICVPYHIYVVIMWALYGTHLGMPT